MKGVTQYIDKHLEDPSSYAQLLFVYFSSAFNMLQPHILIKNQNDFKVNPLLIKWYSSFFN